MPAGRWRKRLRYTCLALAVVLGTPTAYVLFDWCYLHNLGTLEPGRIYRSAQMPGRVLRGTIREHKVRTVLNLRGGNPGQRWYRDEREAVRAEGATLVDVSMSSCQWMSRAQLRTVVRVLDSCEYPLLMHCEFGAERTGWVSAIATLLRPNSTLADAERQFSLAYLFARYGDGQVMAEHLDQYEAWLKAGGMAHSPGRFRQWVDSGFKPGKPSREDWPYDPYPLVVITRPDGTSSGSPVAGAGTEGVIR